MIIATTVEEVQKLHKLTEEPNVLYAGPIRVRPGGLSVSRTIGDIEAKSIKYGGKSGVVVSTPDVYIHRISPADDFILLASDGIFDGITNHDIVSTIFDVIKQRSERIGFVGRSSEEEEVRRGVEEVLDEAVQVVMRKSIIGRSEDNITLIVIFFPAFYNYIKNSTS